MSFPYPQKENRRKKTKRRQNLELLIAFSHQSLPHFWEKNLSQFTLLFDSHDAAHPTGECYQPGSADSQKDQDALVGLGSAAQALDEVELD